MISFFFIETRIFFLFSCSIFFCRFFFFLHVCRLSSPYCVNRISGQGFCISNVIESFTGALSYLWLDWPSNIERNLIYFRKPVCEFVTHLNVLMTKSQKITSSRNDKMLINDFLFSEPDPDESKIPFIRRILGWERGGIIFEQTVEDKIREKVREKSIGKIISVWWGGGF